MIFSLLLFFQSAFAAEYSGVWTANDGTKLIIPFVRDGDIPLLFSNGDQPLIPLWGRWSPQDKSIQFSDQSGGAWSISEGHNEVNITISKGSETIALQRRVQIQDSHTSGIWLGVNGDEFVPIVAGGKIYILHRNDQQITRVYKGEWKKGQENFAIRFRAKKKCTIEFGSNTPNKATVLCGNKIDDWTRHYVPSPMVIPDISGTWRSGELQLKIELDGLKWTQAHLETNDSITVYRPEWAGGMAGKKFYLRHPQHPMILGVVHSEDPAKIVLRIQDKDVSFYKRTE